MGQDAQLRGVQSTFICIVSFAEMSDCSSDVEDAYASSLSLGSGDEEDDLDYTLVRDSNATGKFLSSHSRVTLSH